MIRSREEACRILNVPYNAEEADIKSSYKTLAKRYHPDATDRPDSTRTEIFMQINEAYEYLLNCPSPDRIESAIRSSRVIGGSHKYSQFSSSSSDDYNRFQKKYEKRQAEKKQEFKQKQADFAEKEAKAEADYERAMSAINAIRTARAIEALINNSKRP